MIRAMNKIIIIGCPGAGKSTFSRALSDKTNLPLYHLDMIWHKPDRTNISREEFDLKLKAILETDKWIIDGNYNRTLEMRLNACDTVFLLDLPTELCLKGVEERIGRKREDMPWVEHEFDREFREFIIDFAKEKLPYIYELLQKYKNKNIIVFKSHRDVDEYLTKHLC